MAKFFHANNKEYTVVDGDCFIKVFSSIIIGILTKVNDRLVRVSNFAIHSEK